MLALCYVRVSTSKQEKNGASFEIQREFIKNYCTLNNLILKDEDIYQDTESGTKLNRPAFNALRERIKQSKESITLLIYSIDRLARNVYVGEKIAKDIKATKGKIISVTQGFDDSTPSGNLQKQILLAMAEYERAVINSRMKNGTAKSRKDGKHIGKAPVGYQTVGNSTIKGFGQLKINEKEKKAVLTIFNLKKQGCSFRNIAKKLTELGMLSRNGTPYNPGSIKRILDNESFYKGQISSDTYGFTSMDSKHPKIL